MTTDIDYSGTVPTEKTLRDTVVSDLLAALKTLVTEPVRYVGPTIVITGASHGECMRRIYKARAAIKAAEEIFKTEEK